MKRRPQDENAWFAFNSPPVLALFFASRPFFEGESPVVKLFLLLQLAFRRVGF